MPTVTPHKTGTNRSTAESAQPQKDGFPSSGPGSKQVRIDIRLESARLVLESQPSNMIVPLSEASLAMHSASVGIRLKKNGIANLESNDELFPKNINFKPKFDVPEDLLNSDETKNAIAEFDKLIRDTMIKAKSLIVKQGHRTIRHMEEKRRDLFIQNTLTLASHYATYNRMLHVVPIDTRGLTDAYVGCASLYCYFNGLDNTNPVYKYLSTDKKTFMLLLKEKATKTSTGNDIFSPAVLDHISVGLKIGDGLTEAQVDILPLYDNPPRSPNLLEDASDADIEENPFDTAGNRRLITSTCHHLHSVIVPVFCDTETSAAQVQQDKVANTKLAAVIKHQASLDISKKVQFAIDQEPSVQPHNMEAVVKTQVLQMKKQLEKDLLKELRKNTSGGAPAAATNPNVQSNGKGSKKQPKKQATKAKPSYSTKHSSPNKKQKSVTTPSPKVNPTNPYPVNQRHSPNHYSSHQGRGRGRGRGRGGRSPGRGRGGRGRGRA